MRLCHNSEMDGDGASSDDNHIIMLTIVYVLTKKKIRFENKYSGALVCLVKFRASNVYG